MPYYRQVGDVPRKRHTLHRVAGDIVSEELFGLHGFSGASSLLYHRTSPSALVRIEAVDFAEPRFAANQPVRPYHLVTSKIEHASNDAVLGRSYLFGNDDLRVAWVVAVGDGSLYRNAAGDELVYVQSGSACCESVFGRLDAHAGDYVVVPAGTTHRWRADTSCEMLVMEARGGHVDVPARYRGAVGQMLEGAPFSERDVRGPDELVHEEGDEVPVVVRTRAGLSRLVHANHPFDVVGWDGCCYPWAFAIHDFEPVVGRIHQPPPVHQTFEGPQFTVCSFVPRLFDTDPNAMKIPYHHANVDTDEVLFYSAGDFMSRAGAGIGVGSITIHPAGFVHGPQPGSLERSMPIDRTAEVAVMIDAFAPLGLAAAAHDVSDDTYVRSWSR
ncbi:MAG TPA: cupin domain-containing protein [Acidimicrobiia bacterium]